jgi:thiamine pyrophosphate-dependent acetolactate synthase large subunit-like protein
VTDDPAAAPALGFVSDAIAEVLRRLEIPFIALNPGASYRGLHDSLVNYLGNARPEIVLALHEEHAVAIAHGYAKVTGRPMAAALHSNVGLMHGSMAIFDAWCDRMPVVVLGAQGPLAADRRRPWIDWVHTVQDLGALVRDYTKWDDQPTSGPAALESIVRAYQQAATAPQGPTFVCLDTELQEQPTEGAVALPDAARFAPPAPPVAAPAAIEAAAAQLARAGRVAILMGRVSRDPVAWAERVELAEMLNAGVATDLKVAAAFPTGHPLHVVPPTFFVEEAMKRLLAGADVLLSLDWMDLAGTMKAALGSAAPAASVIHCSLDSYSHRGWSKDQQGLPAVDIQLLGDPDATVPALIERLKATPIAEKRAPERGPPPAAAARQQPSAAHALGLDDIADAIEAVRRARTLTWVRLPGGWPSARCRFAHPLDYLGHDGGAGLASGPGIAVGAALALKGSGRTPVAVLGDGDCAMGVTALWSAARHRLPLVVIVANNRAYMNDVRHQETVARRRNRAVANKWVGQTMDDPPLDFAGLARAQGAAGFGPVADRDGLFWAFDQAFRAADQGGPALVDVLIRRET